MESTMLKYALVAVFALTAHEAIAQPVTYEQGQSFRMEHVIVCPNQDRVEWLEKRFKKNLEKGWMLFAIENGRSRRHTQLMMMREIDMCALELALQVTVLDRVTLNEPFKFIRVAIRRPIYAAGTWFYVGARTEVVYVMSAKDAPKLYGPTIRERESYRRDTLFAER